MIKIKVTEEDIKNGKPYVANSCPIALAVERELNTSYAYVAGDIMAESGFFSLSRAANRFIDRFDKGLPVQPFNFITKQIQ